MVTTPIKRKEDIQKIKEYFLSKQDYRDYALFVVGINTALRISDLLKLTWNDVYDFNEDLFLTHIRVTEQKTSKQTCIAINFSCQNALSLYKNYSLPINPQEYIFYSRNNRNEHIGRNRAYNIIKKAAHETRIDGNISCHSLRKTFGYHAWKRGIPPAVIMNIFNHSDIEITKRYLSIDQDDRDDVFITLNL